MKCRTIRLSIVHPVTVEVEVRSSDGDEWEIESVRRVDCEPTVRSIQENMTDDELDEMQRRARSKP